MGTMDHGELRGLKHLDTSEHITYLAKNLRTKHDDTQHTHTHKPGTASLSFGGAIQS